MRAFLEYYIQDSIRTRSIQEGDVMRALLARVIGREIQLHGPTINPVPQHAFNHNALHLHYVTYDLSQGHPNHYNALIDINNLQQQGQQQQANQNQPNQVQGGGGQFNAQQIRPLQAPLQNQQSQAQQQQQGGEQPQPKTHQHQVNQEELSAPSSFASLKTTVSGWLASLKKAGFMETVKAMLLLQK